MDNLENLNPNNIFFTWETENRTIQISFQSMEKIKKRVKRFGMNYEDFEKLIDKQDGLCGICHSELDFNSRHGYAIDHDHETLQVRGLLCHKCNIRLAYVSVRYKKNKEVNVKFPKYRLSFQTPEEIQEMKKSILTYLNAAESMPESEKRYVKFDAEKIKEKSHREILKKLNAGWDYMSIPILKNGQYTSKKMLVPPNLLPLVKRYQEWLSYLQLTDPRIAELRRKHEEKLKCKYELFNKANPDRRIRIPDFTRNPNWMIDQGGRSVPIKDFSDIPNLLELLKANFEGILIDPEEYRNYVIRGYLIKNSETDKEIAALISQDFRSV